MFKKIQSNISPGATVAKELRKEFSKYFDSAEENGRGFLMAYPKQIFIAMLVLMVLSAIICFLILNTKQQKKPDFINQVANVTTSVTGGIGEVFELKDKVNDIYKLKKQVEHILMKDKLTEADSVFLEKAILVLDSNSKLIREKR